MEKKYIFFEHFQNEKNEMETHPIYEMSEEEFTKIATAKTKVFEIYHFEELFTMLIDNFCEFNNTIMSYADKARLQPFYSKDVIQKRIDINRTALNFFAALNLYQEFLENHLGDIFNEDFWDNNAIFKRCIVMRNYIQHVEFFPIIFKADYTNCDINISLATVRFQINAADLKVEQLRKGTHEDFDKFFTLDENIDLYKIINVGMNEIQRIQEQIRKMPLYTEEYKENKDFLLSIEKKITRAKNKMTNSYLYITPGNEYKNYEKCIFSTNIIKFIDDNIERYSNAFSTANHFITTAPQEFLKKCSDNIFVPAINEKLEKEAKEKSEEDDNA